MLQNIQEQQAIDKTWTRQQFIDLKNMSRIVSQSTPLSEAPRFHEPRFQTKLSSLRECFGYKEQSKQEHELPHHMTKISNKREGNGELI